MFTSIHLYFLDWKEIVTLKQKDTHKTTQGKNYMLSLKLGMNRGRTLNSNLLNSSHKLIVVIILVLIKLKTINLKLEFYLFQF